VTIAVRYFYKNTQKSQVKELIISSLINSLSTLISLPNEFEICIYDLPNNVYGGMDKYIHHRIGLNASLTLEDIPKILVHELIHVHQCHTKLLEIKNGGIYYWRGIPYDNIMPDDMSYQDYKNCPWEIDVEMKIDNLLTLSLELAKKQHLTKLDNKPT
jgi:hypothetical protein